MKIDLTGRRALVTGAGDGVGAGVARVFITGNTLLMDGGRSALMQE